MQTWKKAAIFGAVGAGAVLFFTGRRTPGVVAASAGLAVLASEYPDTFEELWERAPEYVSRGVQIWKALSQILDRFAEQASERSEYGLRDVNAEPGRFGR